METRLISCSRDWTVLSITGMKSKDTLHLMYNEIIRIQFDEFNETNAFRKIRSERINICTSKSNTPIEFTKLQHPKYFEEYKQELTFFAKSNKIELIDNIKF